MLVTAWVQHRREAQSGRAIELRNHSVVCRLCNVMRKATRAIAIWRVIGRHGGVEEPEHVWKLQTREPGDPLIFPDVLQLGTVSERLRRYC